MRISHPQTSLKNKNFTLILLVAPQNSIHLSILALCWRYQQPFLKPLDLVGNCFFTFFLEEQNVVLEGKTLVSQVTGKKKLSLSSQQATSKQNRH